MLQPNRHKDSKSYRYGFNGKEKDDEIKGEGNSIDFGSRTVYDSRLGRFTSLDPKARDYAGISPYAYAANNPILLIDKDG
ncbi:RHS repeat-associated core domain-containing protein, partial [Aquimarina megaterium]